MGILWVTWFGIALVGFGVASIRLATYWAVVAPAVAALAGIGVAAIPGLLARRGSLGWVVLALALVGVFYCAAVYGGFSEAGYGSTALPKSPLLWRSRSSWRLCSCTSAGVRFGHCG